jgi:hypothetical protein
VSDGPLLVPTHLYAMVLNQTEQDETAFFQYQPDYDALGKFEPVQPPPFASSPEEPEPGVHLHWMLPRPLRHARDARRGADTFPWVPNRWLVVRVPSAGAAAPVRAWVVVSDAVGEGGASSYVSTPAAGGIPGQVAIGQSFELASLTSIRAGRPFLQAVRPGDATFTVFAPAARNVFAFHDPVDGIDDGSFTYHVSGWYSEPEHDPTRSVEWKASTDPSQPDAWVDQTFGFSAFAGHAPTPERMLVHALLPGVTWHRNQANDLAVPSDVKSSVTLAVGNTSVDALSEMVSQRRGSPTEGQMLQAFQYGLLDCFDQPASGLVLDRAVRRHWFAATPGGKLWTVSSERPLEEPQTDALDQLNADQAVYERESRVLASMRWTLVALWWKHSWLGADPLNTPGDMSRGWMLEQLAVQLGLADPTPSSTTPSIEQVEAQAAVVAARRADVLRSERALDTLLDPKTQRRKARSRVQYHAPTDPVVLLAGLGRSTVLDPVEALTCRFVSQLVTNDVSVPALDDPHALLPEGVQELHAEAVTLAAQPPQNPAPPSAGGSFPPPAEARQQWQQPWVPLLLDWQVTLLGAPAYASDGRAADLRFDQDKWAFDGRDYTWSGTTDADAFLASERLRLQLSGRTFITPHLPNTLAAQLDQYAAQHSERDAALHELLADLDATLETVSSQDILSQRLSGLRSLLVQRDPAPTAAPPEGSRVAAALGADAQRGRPLPPPPASADPLFDFAPLAGTFFTIDQLRVIDSMGQAIDATYANNNQQPPKARTPAGPGLYPMAAEGVRTAMTVDPTKTGTRPSPPPNNTSERMLQLPPRLAQDAQVDFRLLTADGSDTELALRSSANPICGWIVPNHLDRSLAVYGPDGTALGELSSSSRPGSGYVPVWTPDPTGSNPPDSPRDIENAYLAAMLGELYSRDDDGRGLADFLLTIDESLWTIEPGAPRADQDLAVLVGRPLAVVRAEVSLRLYGLALARQDWRSTFAVDPRSLPADPSAPVPLASDDGGVGALTWSLRLGDASLRDDGLIGLFLDDPLDAAATWSTFRAVARPAEAEGAYVQEIGTSGAPDPRLRFVGDRAAPLDPGDHETVRMTLVLDPRASVHAYTGLLPPAVLGVPNRYTKPALRAMAYLFRAGPILAPPDEIRIPRPAERRGSWSWYDRTLDEPVPIAPADQNATLPATPPRAVEGWLKLAPNAKEKGS